MSDISAFLLVSVFPGLPLVIALVIAPADTLPLERLLGWPLLGFVLVEVYLAYSAVTSFVRAQTAQFYRLVQEDTDGTLSYSETVTARLNEDITDYGNLLAVYPNPVKEVLTVSWSSSAVKATLENGRIFNAFGEVILQGITDFSRVDLRSLPAGLYILEVDVEGKRITKKILKQ